MAATWSTVADQMAKDTGKDKADPSITAAIDALRETKLRPSFVLRCWKERSAA